MNDVESMLESVYEHNVRFKKKDLNRVINAMQIVDRKFFVPPILEYRCYEDIPLPIGKDQTISQPRTVAAMLLYAELKRGMSILEVGAGSGWNACLIQYLVCSGRVIAVERIAYIAEIAKRNIVKLKEYLKKENPQEHKKFSTLDIRTDDALDENSDIWQKKYDRIIITAGISSDVEIEKIIQKMADKLLGEKGMLICPRESGPLKIYKKNKELKLLETKERFYFVPLLGGKE